VLNRVKRVLRPLVPKALLGARTRWLVARQRREFSKLDAERTFERIYARNYWGGDSGEFSSGSGSADAITSSYVDVVRNFVRERGVRSIADLGCGDFRVGGQLLSEGVDYVGVDIVRPLIEHNQRSFAGPRVRFEQLNLIEQEGPAAELGLLRQVLQHLSNAEIARVLENCRHYRYLIVTEHLPVAGGTPNLDKPHGPDIRLYDGSGVFLELPPFSLDVELLLETPLESGQILRSVLLEPTARKHA
jgi:hypothetical protein